MATTRNTVFFEHPRTGIVRQADIGFSWRLLQFGALYPMYHGLWKIGFLALTGQTFTFGASNVVLAFWYNKLHIQALVADGFQAIDTETGTLEDVEAVIGLQLPRHHFH